MVGIRCPSRAIMEEQRMRDENESHFLEPKTLSAIVMVAVVFFGWQYYLGKKYPDYYKPKPLVQPFSGDQKAANPVESSAQKSEDARKAGANGHSGLQGSTVEAKGKSLSPSAPNVGGEAATGMIPEQHFHFENQLFSFDLSSLGNSIRNLTLKDYVDRDKSLIRFGTDDSGPLFSILLNGDEPAPFDLRQTSENSFEGLAKSRGGDIRSQMRIDPQTGKMEGEISVEPTDSFKDLTVVLAEKMMKPGSSSLFMPAVDKQEFIVKEDGKMERQPATGKDQISQGFHRASVVAIGSQYFVSAFVDHSDLIPSAHVETRDGKMLASVVYRPVTRGQPMKMKFVTYTGGKSLERLEAIDPELSEIVNLGFFGAIGKILLQVLRWAHSVVGNWGWAIIILTLLVRALVLPFNVASYRSMKKMQAIQPMLQSLRERYKDDPAALNRESMILMREQKVNPLGGCLPMLLQMPVFFALYQVLGQSIELYQAPFIGWIHDLSLKDPLYILPVLMGAVMFLQQKSTPTTMDPAQAKVLQWMPVIFSFFMLSLPSGLTLYIFVSTLFSVVQQRLFMRDRTKTLAVLDVKAQRVN
ncbi:MAG: membrane protein insertase [Bdellovibrio sp.]|nr:MAG: membrane protein insertase [Bdellovibrio sp.]